MRRSRQRRCVHDQRRPAHTRAKRRSQSAKDRFGALGAASHTLGLACAPGGAQTRLEKPRGIVCQHCTSGKGCAIYATPPKECRDYECGWLAHDDIPNELRPDRCGFILGTTHGKRVVLIHVNERKMREQKRRVRQLYRFAERIVRSGKPVVFFNQNIARKYACGPLSA
jgi:hypothetical protein